MLDCSEDEEEEEMLEYSSAPTSNTFIWEFTVTFNQVLGVKHVFVL